MAQLGRVAGAQEATPAGAQTGTVSVQPATPVPGAQTWHVLVNNVSPEGENWSFSAFYPDNLQAHPGDTIVFTLAPNPQAFQPGEWQSTYFGVINARGPCGRMGQDPCLMPFFSEHAFGLGINSGVLVTPPPDGGDGNRSFTVTLDPALLPGPYYMLSNVDGPTMSGLIDVVAPDQPVQSQEALDAAAELQYQADLVVF